MAQRERPATRIETLLRADGALCVSFANTLRRQLLESYDDLLAWGLGTGVLVPGEAGRLAAAAADHPGKAAGAARRAQTLAARLQRILAGVAAGEEPAATDVKSLNVELRRALAARELDPSGRRWTWGEVDGDDFDRMLWPVLLCAAELLTSATRLRVRRCPGATCGLLFVARGSGKPRKWCGVACRNRHSTKTHYRLRVKPRREARRRSRQGAQRTRIAGYGAES